MKQIQKIKSKHSNNYRSWLVVGVFFCGIIAIITGKNALLSTPYIKIINLLSCLFFMGFALLCLNYLFNKTEILISKQRIILKNKMSMLLRIPLS